MAFDALMMRAVLSEISRDFIGAKIEKVLEPQNDEIDLVIHAGKLSRRLVFNVGANSPRIQLSVVSKENPKVAPVFCMQLRKHLVGAKIVSLSQPNFDRIAFINLSCYDEMGYKTEKVLICEIMGKYANLILTDADGKIITAMKLVDFAASAVRQVLPGLRYVLPEKQAKLSVIDSTREEFFARLSAFPAERSFEKFITETYSGIATRIARELSYRIFGTIDGKILDLDKERAYSVFSEWQALLRNGDYKPTAAFYSDGKPFDYSYMAMSHLEGTLSIKSYESFTELFDAYFAEKDRTERIRQRAFDIIRLVSGAISRTEKKLAIQKEALLDSEKGAEYKKAGDLITENIYRLKRGMESFCATDYYTEELPTIEIKLDPRLDPSKNAQKMYKLYNKAKNAKAILTEQIKIWEAELKYLAGVSSFIEKAETEEDISEIREELASAGYASRLKGAKVDKKRKIRYSEYKTKGGYTVLVGKNNMQNDNLSHRIAEKNDIWFHVKDMPGSHVILVTGGEEPSSEDYTEAAEIAAYFSSAGEASVAVDYTEVKNLRKPQGSKPGFVTYKTNYTAYVVPKNPEVKKW